MERESDLKLHAVLVFALMLLLPLVAGAEGILDDLQVHSTGATSPGSETGNGTAISSFPVTQKSGQPDSRTDEYQIGPLDLIEVEVFQAEELSRETRVNTEGYASLPLIGPVKVAGLTARQAERRIEQVLQEKYLQDPHVTVFIKEYESQKITVEGWVKNPGVFPLKGKTTFLQAIANAKGMDRLADFDEVAIFRTEGGKTTGYVLSYRKVRAGEQIDPVLKSGDIIVVNRSGSKAAWKLFSETLTSFVGWSVLF
jgi:polysaccharide export outer membrane protein